MIDSDRRLLLKSASTDVNISNHGPILGYSQIGVLPKLISILYDQICHTYIIRSNLPYKIIVGAVFFLICFSPFFNIINRGKIYFGGSWKSDIVINKAHDP